MIARHLLLRLALLCLILLLGVGLLRQYHHSGTQHAWSTAHSWQGTGTAILGRITPTAPWQIIWRCQHAASLIGQIDYEPERNQTQPLHQTTTVPCTNTPINVPGEEHTPAYLALSTSGTWSVTLQLLE